MLRAWYFRWVVAGIILWAAGLAVGLAILAGGSGPGQKAGIKSPWKMQVPSPRGPLSPGGHTPRHSSME